MFTIGRKNYSWSKLSPSAGRTILVHTQAYTRQRTDRRICRTKETSRAMGNCVGRPAPAGIDAAEESRSSDPLSLIPSSAGAAVSMNAGKRNTNTRETVELESVVHMVAPAHPTPLVTPSVPFPGTGANTRAATGFQNTVATNGIITSSGSGSSESSGGGVKNKRPSQTPQTLPLSPLDSSVCVRGLSVHWAFMYRRDLDPALLRGALAAALVDFPVLAGRARIKYSSGVRREVEVVLNDLGVAFTVCDSSSTLAQIRCVAPNLDSRTSMGR